MSTLLLLVALLFGQTGWTSSRSRPDVVLEGMFESCPDSDGNTYGERIYAQSVYKSKPAGKHDNIAFEIHLGPRDEFAVFAFDTPDGDVPHSDPRNLLGPAYHFDDVQSRTGRNWSIASLGLHLNVTRAGGSRPDCYSYFVLADVLHRQLAER